MSDGDDTIVKSSPGGALWKKITTNDGVEQTQEASYTWLDGFTGAKNPRYRDQIRSGVNAATNASGQSTQMGAKAPGQATFYGRRYSVFTGLIVQEYNSTMSGDFGGLLAFSMDSAGATEADNTASARFYSKCRSALSALMAGEALGEYKETIKGVRDRGTQLFKTFPAYIDHLIRDLEGRRGKLRRKPRRQRRIEVDKRIADLYLEYKFGWKPLASDIENSIKGIVDSTPLIDTRGVVATARSDAYEPIIQKISDSSAYFEVNGVHRYEGYSSVRYKGAVSIAHERGQRIREQMGLTLDNFIPTVYNLIPYSFIVDYFSNLGEIVNALSFSNTRVNWAIRTERTVCKQSATSTEMRVIKPADTMDWRSVIVEQSLSPSTWSITRTNFVRLANIAVPIPTLSLKWPTSGSVWTNLGALVLSRTKVFSKIAGAILAD